MLSVITVTKNEEENLPRALKSVQDIASEIIVVDSGSTDKTVEIAKSFGAKVYFREWKNYGDQVDYALTLATQPWILVLDADEEVSPELKKSIEKTIKNPEFDCYMINRRTYYLGKFLNHTWYPEWRLRLFKNGKVKYERRVHAKPICEGKIGKLNGDLYHYSFKSLREQFEKTVRFAQQSADLMYQKRKKFRVYNLVINPISYFVKFYFIKRGFLDGVRGLIIALSGSMYAFMKYAILFEKYIKENKQNNNTK